MANRVIGKQPANQDFFIESTTESTSISTGALRVNGGAGIAGNINSSGVISAPSANFDDISSGGSFVTVSTTESTDINTGTIITDGGVGIAKNVNIGGTTQTAKLGVNTSVDSDTVFQLVHGNPTSRTLKVRDNGDGIVWSSNNGSMGVSFSPVFSYGGAGASGVKCSSNLIQFIVDGSVERGRFNASGFAVTGSSTATGHIVSFSTTESTSTTTGAIRSAGGLGIAKRINAGGIISTTDATESTSTSTGSIVTAGGVGIAKNVNIGGGLSFDNGTNILDAIVESNTSFTSVLSAGINISSAGTLVHFAYTRIGNLIAWNMVISGVQSTNTGSTVLQFTIPVPMMASLSVAHIGTGYGQTSGGRYWVTCLKDSSISNATAEWNSEFELQSTAIYASGTYLCDT